MTIPDDRAITTALVADLDRGFVEMVERYQPGIYSGAYRLLRTPHDAEDVAQETFLRAYRSLSAFDDGRIRSLKPRPWLWTIALNLCRNRWARTNGRPWCCATSWISRSRRSLRSPKGPKAPSKPTYLGA